MSLHPRLYVPKARPPAQAKIVTPAEYARQKQQQRNNLKQVEFEGRKLGQPHGAFVTDEAERQKSVILCWKCSSKFDPKKYHYYKTREFKIQGRCDGCREHTQGASFFIYEGLLGRKHGQCWWPR